MWFKEEDKNENGSLEAKEIAQAPNSPAHADHERLCHFLFEVNA